jgi:hypothetical protein
VGFAASLCPAMRPNRYHGEVPWGRPNFAFTAFSEVRYGVSQFRTDLAMADATHMREWTGRIMVLKRKPGRPLCERMAPAVLSGVRDARQPRPRAVIYGAKKPVRNSATASGASS